MRINKLIRLNTLVCLLCGLAACIAQPPERSARQSIAEIAYLRLTEGYWQVWVTDAQGRSHRQVTFASVDKTRVSWSPDRTQLLCNRNDGQLIVVTIATTELSVLSLPERLQGILDAQWSPDGQQIGFSMSATQGQDNNDIWVIKADGTQPHRVTRQPGVSILPSWHAQGQSILYSTLAQGQTRGLWRVDLISGSQTQLTVGDALVFDPSYGPGDTFAYATNTAGHYDIWIHDADQLRQFTDHPAHDSQPTWSPDGQSIAFYSLRGERQQIWVKPVAEGDAYAITPETAVSRAPVWLR